ncbi:hypothetical protein OSCI_1620003 [Kamptonema sp. PCC 6506]|nr:hypothetical protein OSCI_1620003 [Kamptonema sp. PCC 6506]
MLRSPIKANLSLFSYLLRAMKPKKILKKVIDATLAWVWEGAIPSRVAIDREFSLCIADLICSCDCDRTHQ